jgi:hypothetical protein
VEYSAPIIRIADGGRFLQNVGTYTPQYMVMTHHKTACFMFNKNITNNENTINQRRKRRRGRRRRRRRRIRRMRRRRRRGGGRRRGGR